MLTAYTVNVGFDDNDGITDNQISLRDAIADAASGDTIYFNPVAMGGTTVTLNRGSAGQILEWGEIAFNKSLTIDGGAGITIEQYDPTPSQNNGDGSRIFNITGGSSNLVTLKGLTLTGGDVTGSGGAIRAEASFYIENCTIVDNNCSLTPTADGGSGGGIYAHLSSGSITIEDSRIERNSGTKVGSPNNWFYDGGGAYLGVSSGSVTITDTSISDNRALGMESNVGGLFVDADSSTVNLTRVIVNGNHADDDVGGAAIRIVGGVATLTECAISGNTADVNSNRGDNLGGGIALWNYDGSTTIEDCLISDNTITDVNGASGDGAGLHCYCWGGTGVTTTIHNCTIWNNRTAGNGGGIACSIDDGTAQGHVSIENCTISGNKATGHGGGVYLYGYMTMQISHSTITNNRADSDNDGTGAGGGVLTPDGCYLTMDHTIVAKNVKRLESEQTPDDIRNRAPDDPYGPIPWNAVTASWCLIGDIGNLGELDPFSPDEPLVEAPVGSPDEYGNLIGGPTYGVIDPQLGSLVYNGGPVFADGSQMLTHALLWNSPAIDAGNPLFDPYAYTPPLLSDQRGSARVYDVPGIHDPGNIVDIGAFEYEFLVGDYDRNGAVQPNDYFFWKASFGQPADPPFSGADGNGDGFVDAADYTVWAEAYHYLLADYDGNGSVGIEDYNLWKATFGNQYPGGDLRADGNWDGVVDAADYTVWRDTCGSMVGAYKFGLLDAAFGPDVPPEVVGFMLAGGGGFDYTAAAGSGEQLRSVPLVAISSISITFNQQVVISQGALALVNLDGAVPDVFDFEYDSESQTATWTFEAPLADGRYLVRLADSVVDTDSEALDGEFTNPWSLSATGTSMLPSGDGEAGGEFRFRFTVLAGDTDHDNIDGATDYQSWQSTEPGMIIVSTTADECDTDLSFGDVSLREAVDYANTAGSATSIQLLAGRYTLSRTGTESTATVALNDLDITGDVTILGAGPGLSIIDNSGLASAPSNHNRSFTVDGATVRLRLSRLTVANGSAGSVNVASVTDGATLEIYDSAVVNNTAYAGAAAIVVGSANLVVSRSVLTNNDNTSVYGGTAIMVSGTTGAPASITVGESIFALNTQPLYGGGTAHRAIWITSGPVTKENLGKNLYDYAGGGFFDTTPGVDDYLGTPDYVVTSVADTFDHADDLEALSLREAIDLANNAAAPAEVWLPAWRFGLTLDRGANATDTDVAFGDLDIKNSVTIRGIKDRTSVAWEAGVADKVFDLLGDFNDEGQADCGSVSAVDEIIWQEQNGAAGSWEQFSADADDDGDVDADDYTIWQQNFGHTLELFDVAL